MAHAEQLSLLQSPTSLAAITALLHQCLEAVGSVLYLACFLSFNTYFIFLVADGFWVVLL